MPTRRLPSWRQGGVMSGAAGAESVVVRAGPRRGSQRAEVLLVQGVGQPMVAHVAGEHDCLLARGAGDRRGAGVVLPRPRAVVAVGVVAELAEHPGAE